MSARLASTRLHWILAWHRDDSAAAEDRVMSRDRKSPVLHPRAPRGLILIACLATLVAGPPRARGALVQSSAIIRLQQVGFMCANGDSEVQFVELAAIASGQSFS